VVKPLRPQLLLGVFLVALMLLGLLLLGGLHALRRRRQRPTEQGAP
jgi:hypothetical protein